MKLAKLLFLIILIPIIAFLIAYQGLRWFVQWKTSKVPAEKYQIAYMPQPPFPNDNVAKELMAISEPLESAEWNFNCDFKDFDKARLEECRKFTAKFEDVVADFEKIVSKKGKFSLDRPDDLGTHHRFSVYSNSNYAFNLQLPKFLNLMRLSRIIGLKSIVSISEGKFKEGKDSLRSIFKLANFLQQNGILVQLMISESIDNIGRSIIRNYFKPEHVRSLDLSPLDEDLLMKDSKAAWAAEFLSLKNFTITEAVKVSLPSIWPPNQFISYMLRYDEKKGPADNFFSFFDLYSLATFDYEKALAKIVDTYRINQNSLDSKKLGSHFLKLESNVPVVNEEADWNAYFTRDMNKMMGYFYNSAQDMMLKYNPKTGQNIDKARAVDLLIRARKYFSFNKKWPSNVQDFGFKSEAEWPISRLDGNPIVWDKTNKRIVIPTIGGDKPCNEESCNFPFETPCKL